MTALGGLPRSRYLTGFTVIATAWTACLFTHLHFHQYPLLTAEGLILLAGGLVIAALGGAILVSKSRGVETIFATILAFLFVDWNSTSLVFPPLAAAAAALAAWKWRLEFFRFASIILVVISCLSLAGAGQSRPNRVLWEQGQKIAPDQTLPLVIHILFDELEGTAGMAEMSAVPTLAQNVEGALLDEGFTVYSHAYSPHPFSYRAIPALLNGGSDAPADLDLGSGGDARKSRLLSAYADRGYRLSIFDTRYLSLCNRSRDHYCDTHWQSSMLALRDTALDPADRAKVILLRGMRSMISAILVTGIWDERWRSERQAPLSLVRRWELGGLNGLATLERVRDHLETAGPGDALLVHVLFPHYPYLTSRDCALRDPDEWTIPWSDTSIDERQRRYAAQAECAVSLIRSLARTARNRVGKNFEMVVYGDHGSRLGKRPEDLSIVAFPTHDIHAYSTMLAVHSANRNVGRIERQPVEVGVMLLEIGAGTTPGVRDERNR